MFNQCANLLTCGRTHAQITNGTVEEHQGETLLLQLIDRRLVNTVTSSLEMATGDNLQGIADVNDKRTGLVGHVVPLFIAAPNLETRDGHREEQCCQTKVGVAVHTQALGCLLGLLLDGAEKRMAEVALASWATVGLNVIPEIVIGQLEDSGEESQEAAVDGLGQVVGELFDLVHEGVKTFGHTVDVAPVGLVPVELFDTVFRSAFALITKRESKYRLGFS